VAVIVPSSKFTAMLRAVLQKHAGEVVVFISASPTEDTVIIRLPGNDRLTWQVPDADAYDLACSAAAATDSGESSLQAPFSSFRTMAEQGTGWLYLLIIAGVVRGGGLTEKVL